MNFFSKNKLKKIFIYLFIYFILSCNTIINFNFFIIFPMYIFYSKILNFNFFLKNKIILIFYMINIIHISHVFINIVYIIITL